MRERDVKQPRNTENRDRPSLKFAKAHRSSFTYFRFLLLFTLLCFTANSLIISFSIPPCSSTPCKRTSAFLLFPLFSIFHCLFVSLLVSRLDGDASRRTLALASSRKKTHGEENSGRGECLVLGQALIEFAARSVSMISRLNDHLSCPSDYARLEEPCLRRKPFFPRRSPRPTHFDLLADDRFDVEERNVYARTKTRKT